MKTVATKLSVSKYIAAIKDPARRKDCQTLSKMMKKVTGKAPVLWGDSIVGFGTYRYQRANGKEFDFMRTGFSSRKTALTLYIMPGYSDHKKTLEKLGPHKIGKSCLYLKRLADVDLSVLESLIEAGFEEMNKTYPPSS